MQLLGGVVGQMPLTTVDKRGDRARLVGGKHGGDEQTDAENVNSRLKSTHPRVATWEKTRADKDADKQAVCNDTRRRSRCEKGNQAFLEVCVCVCV